MFDAERLLSHVRAWIERCRPLFHGPAIRVGFTDRERTLGVLVEGYDGHGGEPGRDGLFPIASVSKSFTAALLLQEVEAERLDLDDPVSTFLPWFRPASPYPPITLHHLLTHTSGLAVGQEATGEAIHELLQLAAQEPGFTPGERFGYSNAGYKALGLVLEAVTGRPWWELTRERILGPLAMDATEPIMTNDVRPRLMTGHVPLFDDRPWRSEHGLAPAPWFESATADGTICSTAEDMCAYLRMLLAGGGEVLSAESYALMTSPHAVEVEGGSTYGYGLSTWTEEGRPLVGHSGTLHGFSSFVLFDPAAGFGAVVLSNGACTLATRRGLLTFALDCQRAAAAGLELPPLPPPTLLDTVRDAPVYAGDYRSEDGVPRFRAEGDRLLVGSGGEMAPVERLSDDAFVAPQPELARFALAFEREGGAVTAVAHGPRGSPARARRPRSLPSQTRRGGSSLATSAGSACGLRTSGCSSVAGVFGCTTRSSRPTTSSCRSGRSGSVSAPRPGGPAGSSSTR